jgi:hypothetical protein
MTDIHVGDLVHYTDKPRNGALIWRAQQAGKEGRVTKITPSVGMGTTAYTVEGINGDCIAANLEIIERATPEPVADPVNHPAHYRLANGAEVIDLTENLDFLRGNAVKYIARAGVKDAATELQDLKKAQWYLNRAISNLEARS